MSRLVVKIIDFAVILILLFAIPVYYNTSLNDSTTNVYVLREVDLFGDQVCKNGYISVEMYEDLLNKLSNTDLLYNIQMTHTHDVYYPSSTGGSASTEQDITYTDDIKRRLYASAFRSLTYYDAGDYVYGSDGMLYRYAGSNQIFPYDPALISDFDSMTGASTAYPYWILAGRGMPGKYLLHDGDRFSITVSNRSETVSQKISSVLHFGKSLGIHAYGGGTVTDEVFTF